MVVHGEMTMGLMLELPPELENELSAEAARRRLTLAEYVLHLLQAGTPPNPPPRTGAELVNYWQGEGLVGTRPEIVDRPTHERKLRDQAQSRERR